MEDTAIQKTEMISQQTAVSFMGNLALLSYVSDVTLAGGKKNEHLGRITKRINSMPVRVISPGEYGAHQREINPEFEIKPRKWGVRLENGLIEHKGVLYMEVVVTGKGDPSEYFLDGNPIDKKDIIGLKPTQVVTESEDAFMLRAIKLSNIISII